MKSAVVLFTDTPQFLQLTDELNAFMQRSTLVLTDVELWLLYDQHKPTVLPALALNISEVKLIKMHSPYLPEALLVQLSELQQTQQRQLLLFCSDNLSSELATRLAFRLQGSSCLNVDSADLTLPHLRVTKAVYANNLIGTFQLAKPPYCLAIARSAANPPFNVAAHTLSSHLPSDTPCTELTTHNRLTTHWVKQVNRHLIAMDESRNAKIVLAIGRGANQQQIPQLQQIAKLLGAYLVGSRPLIMDGCLSIDRMLGVSGLQLSPALCIVAGASGSAAFSAGIRGSQLIIAINRDPQAAIFKIADIGIVDDLMPVLNELAELVNAEGLSD